MIDRKKIAVALREIASFYGPDDGCSNAIYDGLTAIADELDPPEPKPLLADAQVGDLCKRHDGSFCQITDVIDGFPKLWKTANLEFHTSDGVYYPICTNADNTSPIIATEPLAEVGSAEWAWQMMLLGKKVTHIGLAESRAYYCADDIKQMLVEPNGEETPFDWDRDRWCKCNYQTGWQLYEPKPQPAFAVGDWAEYKGKQYRISAIGGKGLFDDDNLIMFEGVIWCVSEKAELRKLDPSEVIVKIGCLEGTVERAGDDRMFLVSGDGHTNACIMLAMLDAPTRELVKALLAAQEEK